MSGVHTGRIVPFYEKTGAVTPNMQRRLVRHALDQLPSTVPDMLPEDLRGRLALVPRRQAIEQAHFPPQDASRRTERVPHARTAAADFRRVLSLSDWARMAASRDEHRAEAVRAEGG